MLETGSTNADLLARVAGGDATDGQWLVAARQRAGRGRAGRDWASSDGNFHGSTAIALRDTDPPAPTLALVAGLAVHRAIETVGHGRVNAVLKWPNDVLVAGAKLAGILLERVGDHVVAGFGVNIAVAPPLPDRSTVALQALGVRVEVKDFAPVLAETLADAIDQWRGQGLGSILRRWEDRAHPKGTRVASSDGTVAGLTGVYDGLDDSGALRLRLDDGSVRIVTAGDIQVVDPT